MFGFFLFSERPIGGTHVVYFSRKECTRGSTCARAKRTGSVFVYNFSICSCSILFLLGLCSLLSGGLTAVSTILDVSKFGTGVLLWAGETLFS